MEDGFKNIDDLLRSSLDEYQKQPTPKVWKGVSRSLFYSGLGKIILLVTGVIVLSVAGYLYWDYTYVDSVIRVEANAAQNNNGHGINELANEDGQQYGKSESETSFSKADLNEGDEIIEDDGLLIGSENELKAEEIEGSVVDMTAPEINTNGNTVKVVSTALVINDVNNSQTTYPGLPSLSDDKSMEKMKVRYPYIDYSFLQQNSIGSVNERNQYKGMPVVPSLDYGRGNLISYGVYVSPEVIFMNDEENAKKLQLNIDAVMNYKPNEDFYLQGGIGVGVSQDDGRYEVDYEQYDSVGYYYEVNSFIIDPITGKPVYKTSVENVYDTVGYNSLSLTGNRYTYLRLSGFLGYRVHHAKRFSVFVKGGLTYSILVNSYEPDPDFTNEDAINLEITNETAQRINDTWQASAGVGFNYRLSNNLTLTGEPIFNYYIKPVYERSLNVKNPYSLGLKLGVLFKF